MAIKPVGYTGAAWTYGGPPKPYIAPKPPPITYSGPTGFVPGYQPGAVPSSAGYQTYGGSTYAAPAILPSVPRSGGGAGTSGGGGTTTTTTYTPAQVYESDILADPSAIGAQQAFEATTQQLHNTRQARFRQALIASGYDPGPLPADLADYGGDIDQATRDAAAANQLSSRAQLNKALNQAMVDLPYQLARRGVARSGALPVGQTSLNEQYQVQAQQGLSDLLNTLRGYGSEYAGGYSQAMQGLNAAREAVAQRLAQQRGYSQTVTSDYGDQGGGGGEEGLPPGYGDGGGPQRADAFQQLQDFVASLPPSRTPGVIPFAGGGNLNTIARRIVQQQQRRKVRAG